MLPLSRSGATLTIAMADPTNVFAMDDIKFMTGYNVEPVVASESTLEDAIDKYYGSTRSLELRRDTAPAAGYGTPGGGPTLKEVLEGPTLSVDDMAAIGGLVRDRPRLDGRPRPTSRRSSPTTTRSTSATSRSPPTPRRSSS